MTKTRHRLTGPAAWPMTAEEWERSAETFAGIPLTDLSNAYGTVYGAHGHVSHARMVAAAIAADEAGYGGIPDRPTLITPDQVEHTWAVMEPSWPGAPDDEWHLNWGREVTWATPGAFPLTVARVEEVGE